MLWEEVAKCQTLQEAVLIIAGALATLIASPYEFDLDEEVWLESCPQPNTKRPERCNKLVQLSEAFGGDGIFQVVEPASSNV